MMMTLFDDEQILKAYTKEIEDNTARKVERETAIKVERETAIKVERETAIKKARETAERMIKKGKLSLEEIADYVPSLSLEELKKIEAEVSQLS